MKEKIAVVTDLEDKRLVETVEISQPNRSEQAIKVDSRFARDG